jgi:hypothetical protein
MKNSQWHRCHDFVKGLFWLNVDTRSKVYIYELSKRNIEFEGFINLSEEAKKVVVDDIEGERRVYEQWLIDNPIKIKPIDTIQFPKITKGSPTDIDIASLCGVQPMTQDNKLKIKFTK